MPQPGYTPGRGGGGSGTDATARSAAAAAQSTANAAVPSSTVGQANGVAGLDANSHIPAAQLNLSTTQILIPITSVGSAPSNTVGNDGDCAIEESTGVIWGPKASGAWPSTPKRTPVGGAGTWGSIFLSGSWYPNIGTGSALSMSNNNLAAMPFPVNTVHGFTTVGCNVATTGTAATARFGVYADNGGQPGALVQEFGTVAVSATGALTLTISGGITLTPALYWLALVMQGSTAAPTITTYNVSPIGLAILGGTAPGAQAGNGGWAVTGVSGALPATFSTPGTPTKTGSNGSPYLSLQAA